MAVTINGTTGIVTPDLGVDGTTLVVDAANNRVGVLEDSPNNTLTVGDTVQPSYAPTRAGNYIEIARTSGADAGLLINKDTGQWLVGVNNSDGANAPLRFEYAAAGSSHPGFGAGTLGMIIKHNGNVGIGTDNPSDHLEILNNNASGLTFKTTENHYAQITSDCNRTGANSHLLAIEGYWNGTPVAEIALTAGSDTTNKDDGQIIFRTSSANNLTSNERLRITAAGLVGIGTDNPTATLEVATSVDGEATLATFKNTSGGGTNETVDIKLGLENTVASNIILRAGKEGNHSSGAATDNFFAIHTTENNTSAEKLRITSAGNIGINSTNPTSYGNSQATLVIEDDTNPAICISDTGQSRDWWLVGQGDGLTIRYADGGGSGSASNVTSAAFFKNNGNTGLGTNSPTSKLSLEVGSGGEYFLDVKGSAARQWGFYYDQNSWLASTFRIDEFSSTGTATTRFAIADGGKVGININDNTAADLHVKTATNSNGVLKLGGNAGSAVGLDITYNNSSYTSTIFKQNYRATNAGALMEFDSGYFVFKTGTSGAERLRISSGGDVAIGADAYGNVAPLAKLHVSSTGTTTAIGADHGYLRSSCQILCQASDNADNSKSGIMFSGALHSTDGCSAAVVANHESVGENSEKTSLSFYTSHNETLKESLKITSDAQFEMNGVRNIYQSFLLLNNTTYNWDFPVPSEGGYGNSFYLVAGYNHYYTTSYGAHRTVWFSSRGTSVNVMGNGIEQTHSQAGSWTFSKPSSTIVRITKTNGTYGGSGYGFFHLMYNHF